MLSAELPLAGDFAGLAEVAEEEAEARRAAVMAGAGPTARLTPLSSENHWRMVQV